VITQKKYLFFIKMGFAEFTKFPFRVVFLAIAWAGMIGLTVFSVTWLSVLSFFGDIGDAITGVFNPSSGVTTFPRLRLSKEVYLYLWKQPFEPRIEGEPLLHASPV